MGRLSRLRPLLPAFGAVAIFGVAATLWFTFRRSSFPAAPPMLVAASFTGVRVDDTVDLFASIDDSNFPDGVERIREPVWSGTNTETHFIELTSPTNETLDSVLAGIGPWLAKLAPPSGTRLVWGPFEPCLGQRSRIT